MANERDPKEHLHERLLDVEEQNLTEEQADELREAGRGFRRDTGDEAERLAQGQDPSEDERSYQTPALHAQGDEDAGRRQHRVALAGAPDGRGDRPPSYSESERTQVEEDFGERGLRTRGGRDDSAHEPSILDEPED